MSRLFNLTKRLFILILLLVLIFIAWVYATTFHPAKQQAASLSCPAQTPVYNPQIPLSILSYNVQYFAGKNYVFYYDLPDNKGPDLRPSRADIEQTLDGIAKLIQTHNPDVLLLQEVHDNASASDKRNQLAELQQRLPQGMYPCVSETFYWQASYIPHPNIMGSVGMKLVTLSKYKLSNAIRHRLPQPPMDWVSAQFYLKRAILKTQLVTPKGHPEIQLLNTHFDAFAQGSNTMEQQVDITKNILEKLDSQGVAWVLAGDLNLLLPNERNKLQASQQYLYKPHTELSPLLKWQHIPNTQQLAQARSKWLTHLPNDPDVTQPDRVIDYLFHASLWQRKAQQVLNQGAPLMLSDHFPVTSTLQLKPN